MESSPRSKRWITSRVLPQAAYTHHQLPQVPHKNPLLLGGAFHAWANSLLRAARVSTVSFRWGGSPQLRGLHKRSILQQQPGLGSPGRISPGGEASLPCPHHSRNMATSNSPTRGSMTLLRVHPGQEAGSLPWESLILTLRSHCLLVHCVKEAGSGSSPPLHYRREQLPATRPAQSPRSPPDPPCNPPKPSALCPCHRGAALLGPNGVKGSGAGHGDSCSHPRLPAWCTNQVTASQWGMPARAMHLGTEMFPKQPSPPRKPNSHSI